MQCELIQSCRTMHRGALHRRERCHIRKSIQSRADVGCNCSEYAAKLVACGAGGKQDVASLRCISYMSLLSSMTFSPCQEIGVAYVTRPEFNLQALAQDVHTSRPHHAYKCIHKARQELGTTLCIHMTWSGGLLMLSFDFCLHDVL